MQHDSVHFSDHSLNSFVKKLEAKNIRTELPRGSSVREIIYYGNVDQKPALVVRPTNATEVSTVVNLCTDAEIAFGAVSGGHHISHSGVKEQGVLIDFSLMREVAVTSAGMISVETGATWAEFDRVASKSGLATTGGIVSVTGVFGLSAGGGFGWLMGEQGPSCDSIVGVEIVTCDGQVRWVDNNHEPDLLWAMKGCGTEFGIVTRMLFKPMAVSEVVCGSIQFDVPVHDTVLINLEREMASSPDWVTISPQLLYIRNKPVLSIDICSTRQDNLTASLVDRLSQEARSNSMGKRRFVDWQSLFDNPRRKGLRSHWESAFSLGENANLLAILQDAFINAPSEDWLISLDHLHGKVNDPNGFLSSCFPHRNERTCILINANWADPSDDSKNIDYAKNLMRIIDPFRGQSKYCNYVASIDEEQMAINYSRASLDRLISLKDHYDPYRVIQSVQKL